MGLMVDSVLSLSSLNDHEDIREELSHGQMEMQI